MGRGWAARCQKEGALKRGAWTAEEDQKLVAFIEKNKGHGSWRTLPRLAGLQRCGKSCRLRWINYLRPDIKRGNFSPEEERTITQLHALMGNKWSAIAARMPGRTDNEVKNHWNTHLKKRLARMGFDPTTHRPVLLQPAPGSHLKGVLRPPLSAQPAEQSRHARPLLSLLDKSFVSHMAQWELARLEAEARLSASSSSSPSLLSARPTSLKPNSSIDITLSPDCQRVDSSQFSTIVDSNSSSSSPALRPVELCAESATYGSDNVHLKDNLDWCATPASDSAVSALLSFFDDCISASDQNCCPSMLNPRVLQQAGNEDEPLQIERGRMSLHAFDSSGCPADANSGLRGARTATTMAPLPSKDLQLDATASCGPPADHDIPQCFEDILSTSPDQPCLSASTSLWSQDLLDYAGLSCYAC